MKRIDNCENSAVLVGLLLAGILLVMGGYAHLHRSSRKRRRKAAFADG